MSHRRMHKIASLRSSIDLRSMNSRVIWPPPRALLLTSSTFLPLPKRRLLRPEGGKIRYKVGGGYRDKSAADLLNLGQFIL